MKLLPSVFAHLTKTDVYKIGISSHTALNMWILTLRSYFKLICEYERHTLPDTKVIVAKDHGKNYIKVRLFIVRRLLRNRL